MSPAIRLTALRLVRTPRSLVAALGWIALGFVAAFAERGAATPGASRVLLGTFGAIALPLLVYVVVGAAVGGKGIARATHPLVVLGADPMRTAASTILVAAGASAVLCAVVSPFVAAIAHGPNDPPLGFDIVTTAWIGALAGIAYAAWFALGAALAKSGIGRGVFLGIDWVLGDGRGAGAILTPRAHLRNLLGGAPPLDLPQRASTVALVTITIVLTLAALVRVRRARI